MHDREIERGEGRDRDRGVHLSFSGQYRDIQRDVHRDDETPLSLCVLGKGTERDRERVDRETAEDFKESAEVLSVSLLYPAPPL